MHFFTLIFFFFRITLGFSEDLTAQKELNKPSDTPQVSPEV